MEFNLTERIKIIVGNFWGKTFWGRSTWYRGDDGTYTRECFAISSETLYFFKFFAVQIDRDVTREQG